MSVYRVHTWCLRWVEESIRSPEMLVIMWALGAEHGSSGRATRAPSLSLLSRFWASNVCLNYIYLCIYLFREYVVCFYVTALV